MRLIKSIFGRANDSIEWQHASEPDSEISLPWRDEFWPTTEWYDILDLALGKVGELWQFDNPKADKKLASRMTKEQFLLWAVLNVDGQVCNGGFIQVFSNSYGELAEESITGLRTIGLIRQAEIYDEAFTLFGARPVPRNRETRIKRLNKLANLGKGDLKLLSSIERTVAVYRAINHRWRSLETEYYALSSAKAHGVGHDPAFNQPIAEWIYKHRDRFFITS